MVYVFSFLQRYDKKCTFASKICIFAFFGLNRVDNPNIFRTFAAKRLKHHEKSFFVFDNNAFSRR